MKLKLFLQLKFTLFIGPNDRSQYYDAHENIAQGLACR